jgi:hypothetical protein
LTPPTTPTHSPARDRAVRYALVAVSQPRSEPERPRRWPRTLALVLGVALAGGAAHWSVAQQRAAPRITVPPTIQAEPASQAPLGIKVDPADAIPSSSFVRLRGFPTSVSLTEGHAIAPGAWAIPLFGLSSLKAIVPAGVSGRAEILITLVDVDGNTLAYAKTALVIGSSPAETVTPESPRPPPVASLPKQAAPQPPVLSAETKAQAERMLANGLKQLDQGNIGAARMFLQRAAEEGSGEAALKLAETFDPAVLARVAPLAVKSADLKEAKRWYEKARELGAPEAEVRLGRLGARQ